MNRFRPALALAAAAMILAPGVAHAQAKKPAAAAPRPSPQQLQQAVSNFNVMISALKSDSVPEAVKSVLFSCIYSNPFSKINENTEKVLVQRKAARTPDNIAGAMSAVCGLRPEMLTKPAAKK